MTAPQLFGALVRAIGVYWLSVGLSYLTGAYFAGREYSPMAYVVQGAANAIIGVFLMFKADGMVQTCYSLNALSGHNSPDRPRIQLPPSGGLTSEDPNSPQILIVVQSESQASLIVNHLATNGIKASVLGIALGNLWPEIPRDVQVVVRQADIARARKLLDSIEENSDDDEHNS